MDNLCDDVLTIIVSYMKDPLAFFDALGNDKLELEWYRNANKKLTGRGIIYQFKKWNDNRLSVIESLNTLKSRYEMDITFSDDVIPYFSDLSRKYYISGFTNWVRKSVTITRTHFSLNDYLKEEASRYYY